jgi:hypothetical protein
MRTPWAYHESGSSEPKQWKRLKEPYIINERFIAFMDRIFRAKESEIKRILDEIKANP